MSDATDLPRQRLFEADEASVEFVSNFAVVVSALRNVESNYRDEYPGNASGAADEADSIHGESSPSVGCGDTPNVGDVKEGEEGFEDSSSSSLRGGESDA